MSNPKVYFDMSPIDTIKKEDPTFRMVIELFADKTPQIAGDFLGLCTGVMGEEFHYKGCKFSFTFRHGFCCVVGPMNEEYNVKLGAGNYHSKHHGPGAVWMLDGGRRFCIAPLEPQQERGRPFMVGRVVEGLDIIQSISHCRIAVSFVISDCGQLLEPKVSKRPREDSVGVMLKLNAKKQQLSDIGKEFKNAKEQLVKVNATHLGKKQLADVEEMANSVRHNIDVLNDLLVEATSLKEHQSELLGEMDKKISNLKEGKVFLEAIPSFPDEVLDDIESAIKKLKRDRAR